MKEITGAKKGDNKAILCWCASKRTNEKKMYFLQGEVFFLLTGSLMGDPFAQLLAGKSISDVIFMLDMIRRPLPDL